MLKNILEDYLSQIKEREFDLPFLALLQAMGFYDIHYTHGQQEFGKDFIAKLDDNGCEIQYSFQLKAGNINQNDWRGTIQGQMLEAVTSGLSHPNFSRKIPHQSILVVTGRLLGNSALGLQELNELIENNLKLSPIKLWDLGEIVDRVVNCGVENLYSTTAEGFTNYGDFYILYGKCLKGNISDSAIEKHSRQWINQDIPQRTRLLGAAIESEIISNKCKETGQIFEANYATLAFLRAVEFEIQNNNEESKREYLLNLFKQTKNKLIESYQDYIEKIQFEWEKNDKKLAILTNSVGNMITYLVHCSRIIEITGILCLLLDDDLKKAKFLNFLISFLSLEPGCAHVPSDNYATGLVSPILALLKSGNIESAKNLIKRATIWLCDNFQEGAGLALFGATEYEEIATLFGQPFEFIQIPPNKESFLGTLLCDLSAFIDINLYKDVVNDIKASDIAFQYWQLKDSLGIYSIDSQDIIAYPNIEFNDEIMGLNDLSYANHITHESKTYTIIQLTDLSSVLFIMNLLHDRYFPTMWGSIIQNTLS